jgi:hypothetical protein
VRGWREEWNLRGLSSLPEAFNGGTVELQLSARVLSQVRPVQRTSHETLKNGNRSGMAVEEGFSCFLFKITNTSEFGSCMYLPKKSYSWTSTNPRNP